MRYPASRARLPSRLLLFTVAVLLSSPVLGAPAEEGLGTAEAPQPGHAAHGQLWASRGKSPKKPPITVSRTGKEGRNPEAARAGQATPQASDTSEKSPKPRTGGETEATKRGREAHIQWDPGPGFEKEVTLPSGKRADAVSFENREVKELKPDNPRAQKRGERQVEGYRRELEKERGGEWKGKVESYKP